MGCDIHLVVERKEIYDWIAVHIPEGWSLLPGHGRHQDWASPLCRARNYERFSALAGVRGNGPKPRGVPDDAAQTTRYMIAKYGPDGHSHSWLPLDKATEIFLQTERADLGNFERQYPASTYFNVESEDMGMAEWRVVFWFDN